MAKKNKIAGEPIFLNKEINISKNRGGYYNAKTGSYGYGKHYGEFSYNSKPIVQNPKNILAHRKTEAIILRRFIIKEGWKKIK